MKMRIFSAAPGSAGWNSLALDVNKFLASGVEVLSVSTSATSGALYICVFYKQ